MIPSMFVQGPPVARRDVLITSLFALAGVPFVGFAQEAGYGGSTAHDLAAGGLILLAIVPLLWRRRAPLVAAAATLAGIAVHVAAFGAIGRCGLLLPLVFVESFAVAARLDRRESSIGLAILLGADVVCMSADSSAGWSGLTVAIPITVAVWCIGRVVRSRAALAARLRDRNVELRIQREENARLQVESERLRLSGELEQLLQTRLSELARLAESGPGEGGAASTLAKIEAESRATLEQMRTIVGVLRDDAATDPQPTLAHLDALLLAEKGGDARLTVTGEPRVLPAALELSAFRVVEHLLAATGDAKDVHVHVDFGADALEFIVSGPSHGSRRQVETALNRARERLALHHGCLSAETDSGRTRVTAALPVVAVA